MSEEEKIEEQAKEELENETEEKDYEAEYNALKDQYLRANAEFENIKKRLRKKKKSTLWLMQTKALLKICLMF